MPLIDSLLLVVGIGLLVAGGETMVRGAAALARQLGVPPLAIGLTVVAFGTSAPELAVNVSAALGGNGGIAFGNVVGSNLANIGLILGGSALVRTLAVHSTVLSRELPMMLLAFAATAVMGFDALRGLPESSYDRSEGLLLLLLFAVFLYYTIGEARRSRRDPLIEQARARESDGSGRRIATSGALVVVGLAGLALGGHLTVDGAVGIATALGAPKGLIGLTVVAVGTSLPELSASLLAARRGETDLAIGNVVGSNVFNLLFVLATTATIRPVPIPVGGEADLLVMLVFGVVLLVFSLGGRSLTRREGVLLILGYLAYIGWRAAGAAAT